MNQTLLGLAVVAVLSSSAAFAHDRDDDERERHERRERGHGGRGWEERRQWRQGRTAGAQGHYELRSTQQWVEGHQEQQWVPPACAATRWGQRCTPGYTRSVWRPGAYVASSQWVWVPGPGAPVYGSSVGQGYGTGFGLATEPIPPQPAPPGTPSYPGAWGSVEDPCSQDAVTASASPWEQRAGPGEPQWSADFSLAPL